MNQKEKAKYTGVVGAVLVHLGLILLLFAVSFQLPEKQEEGGVPLLLGEVPHAVGQMDPSLVEVDVMSQEATPMAEMVPEEVVEAAEQEVITQETEESVAIPPKAEPKKESVKPVKKKPEKPAKVEKTEAEKAEEARKADEAEKARKQAEAEKAKKAAEEATRKLVAGAFGKGAKMSGQGDSKGSGIQGNPAGNASTGKENGSSDVGNYYLPGRHFGPGGLPKPVYNVQDEGRVVVDILVNPEGRVINTSINRQTNTVNSALRKAAEDAARQARFNAIDGVDNQRGTITYYFKLK